ncbi:DJ-1/PfpI family protein [Serratia bockelmannii]|uniref:DJ-1/PfpI family protein n=1 Tax=Serratia bockelmannii TaxID=2703793 RepID=UPI00313C2108
MHISIITLEGFNEIDSLVMFNILNRVKGSDWKVSIASATPKVSSMNGLVIESDISLEDVYSTDAVIIGSGSKTRELVLDQKLMSRIELDPSHQLIGSQCSGIMVLGRLNLLSGIPVCTDKNTKTWALDEGIKVVDKPFNAIGNVATAGGCLASHYLAAWVIARLKGLDAAYKAISYISPTGEEDDYVNRAIKHIYPYI